MNCTFPWCKAGVRSFFTQKPLNASDGRRSLMINKHRLLCLFDFITWLQSDYVTKVEERRVFTVMLLWSYRRRNERQQKEKKRKSDVDFGCGGRFSPPQLLCSVLIKTQQCFTVSDSKKHPVHIKHSRYFPSVCCPPAVCCLCCL